MLVSVCLSVRFYPSEARKVAEKIIAEELMGKEYDEDDAKELSLTICERIKAAVKGEAVDEGRPPSPSAASGDG